MRSEDIEEIIRQLDAEKPGDVALSDQKTEWIRKLVAGLEHVTTAIECAHGQLRDMGFKDISDCVKKNAEKDALLSRIKEWMMENDYDCGAQGAEIYEEISELLK